MSKQPLVDYFGYGAMASSLVMEAVIGRTTAGEHARLRGMKLCIQRIDQVPEPAQAVLRRNWPETFRSYTMVPDPAGVVSGVIWNVTPQELALIRNWELDEFDWFVEVEVTVDSSERRRLSPTVTHVMKGKQDVESDVDGEKYKTLLVPLNKIVDLATQVRREFLAKA